MDFLTERDRAKHKANQYFFEYCEYTTYWDDKEKWENMNNPIICGVRLAIGQYMLLAADVIADFSEFVECLSSDFCGGALIEARKNGDLPEYSLRKAKKYRIGRDCAVIGSAEYYGYERG